MPGQVRYYRLSPWTVFSLPENSDKEKLCVASKFRPDESRLQYSTRPRFVSSVVVYEVKTRQIC